MAEKILNTRIQLKYDTLTNWTNSTFTLKKGEIAIVEVPTVEGSTLQPVMFKVGDGTKTFSQLDWASAKAADVYGWAKTKAPVLDGQVIKFKNASDEVVHSIDLSTFVTNDELTTILNDYQPKGDYKVVQETKSFTGSTIKTATGVTQDTNGVINVTFEDIAFPDPVDISGKKDKQDEKSGSLTGAQVVSTWSQDEQGVVSIASRDLTPADIGAPTKAEAQGYANAKDEAIADAKKAGTDAAAALESYKGVVTTALAGKQDTIPANTYDAYGSAAAVLGTDSDAATANTVYGAKVAAAAAQKTADDVTARVEAFLDGEEIAGTVDTLKEIQKELEALGDAVDLEEQFAAKVDKTVYEEHLTTQDTRDDGQDAKITALEGKAGLDKVGTVTSITAGDGLAGGTITESGTIALNDATKASLALADTALQEHQDISGKADKVTGATNGNFAGLDANGNLTDSGKKAADFAPADIDTGVHAVSLTSGTNNGTLKLTVDDATTDNIAVTGLGSAAFTEAGAYATAEQGGKADTALQTVAAGDGIKVTEKADNSQTISIDDTIVWVFDCGNASDKINPIA